MIGQLFVSLQHSRMIVAMDSSVTISMILEITHYFGFFLLVGSLAAIDLRVLGVTSTSITAVEFARQLFPYMWAGFFLAILSGFLMFAEEASGYVPNPVFHAKVAVILLAVVFGALVQWNVRRWGRSPKTPASAKLLAAISLLLWLGAILAALEVPAITGVG
jgi:hypothetical protein